VQLKVRQRATDHAVGDTRPNHRPDGGYSQQVYGMGEDKTTSSSCGSDKGGRKLGIYRVFVTGKFSHFLALSISITKKVADMAKVTIND